MIEIKIHLKMVKMENLKLCGFYHNFKKSEMIKKYVAFFESQGCEQGWGGVIHVWVPRSLLEILK